MRRWVPLCQRRGLRMVSREGAAHVHGASARADALSGMAKPFCLRAASALAV
jgi:hypothetical protein